MNALEEGEETSSSQEYTSDDSEYVTEDENFVTRDELLDYFTKLNLT